MKEGLQDLALFLCLTWVADNLAATEAKGAGPRLVLYIAEHLKGNFGLGFVDFLGSIR